jgi:hypothetical protein
MEIRFIGRSLLTEAHAYIEIVTKESEMFFRLYWEKNKRDPDNFTLFPNSYERVGNDIKFIFGSNGDTYTLKKGVQDILDVIKEMFEKMEQDITRTFKYS